jgi:hypothetical protein
MFVGECERCRGALAMICAAFLVGRGDFVLFGVDG